MLYKEEILMSLIEKKVYFSTLSLIGHEEWD